MTILKILILLINDHLLIYFIQDLLFIQEHDIPRFYLAQIQIPALGRLISRVTIAYPDEKN